MRRVVMWFKQVMVSCIACILLVSGCGKKGDDQTEKITKTGGTPVQVEVFVVREEQIQMKNEVVGTVEALQRATIASKVTGTIAKMPVELGSLVKKDDLLVELKADEIAARLAQAKTLMDQSKRNLEREQRLLAQNASAQEKVNMLQDAFQVAEATLSEAKILFSYTTVRSPFGGRIAAKNAQPGDLAIAGAPLLILENNQRLQVVGAMPEEVLGKIQIGANLQVKIPAAALDVQGQIAEIAPAADALTRTIMVKISIPSTPALRPGQFARISLPGGASSGALYIPESAVQRFGQMERVYVVKDKAASLRLVRTGARRDGFIEILSGLSSGDQAILNSANLAEGQSVTVMP